MIRDIVVNSLKREIKKHEGKLDKERERIKSRCDLESKFFKDIDLMNVDIQEFALERYKKFIEDVENGKYGDLYD